MRFIPIDEVNKEEPSGLTFVPLQEEVPAEQEVKGVKKETKRGESVLAGTTLTPGVEPVKAETFKLPGFEHLYPSEESPFNLSEQARTEKLIMQGLDPEFARATARRNIAEDKATTGREYGQVTEQAPGTELAESLRAKPGATGIEDTAQVLKRAGVKAVAGTAQAGGGMQRFVGEMLGLDASDEEKTLDNISSFTQTMGAASSKPAEIIEGAFNSIGQQLPALVAGVATGSQALVLTSMFANSFGQTYDDSRRRDLDATDATARAAAYAAFEVIGEKFGLGDQLIALKKLATGVPEKDLAEFFAKSLAKEIPGEQLTYAGQFAVDKGFGLNPEAGLKDFIQGAVDTMLVTATQGGIMLGGGMTLGKITQKGGRKEPEAAVPSAADLAKEKGFTFVPLGQTKEDVVAAEPIAKEPTQGIFEQLSERYNSDVDRLKQKAAELTSMFTGKPAVTEEPAQALLTERVKSYTDLGLDPAQASELARQDLVEAGYGDRLDTGVSESGVSVPSEQLAATPGATTVDGTGVGGDSQTTVLPPSGTKVEPSALKPVDSFFEDVDKKRQVDYKSTKRLVSMPIDQFLTLAERIETPQEDKQERVSKKIEAGEQFSEAPYLNFATWSAREPNGQAQVVGHEGRHRAMQLKKMGYTHMPVELRGDIRWSEQGDPTNADYDKEYPSQIIGQNGDVMPFPVPREMSTSPYVDAQQGAPTAASAETVTPPTIAPVTKGKPRGKPKTLLTEEQIAASKKKKAEQTKEWKATKKSVDAALEVLDVPAPERSDFESQDAYLDASMQHRAKRNQTLDLLRETAFGPKRGTKLGTDAKEGLNHSSVTVRELAESQQRYELKKGTSRAELIEATNGNENQEYSGFRTVGQALSWLSKTGNEFESTLAKRIMPFVRNMQVVIVRSPADLPTNYLRKQFEGAAGMYSNGVIYLDANGGMNNTVFLHEALHGATIDRINSYLDDVAEGREPPENLAEAVEELNAVMKSAGRLYEALNKLGMTDERTDALARAGAFTDIKEFIAYGMSQPAMQEFLLQAPGMYSGTKSSFIDELFTRFVQSIRKMFNMTDKHNSAMQDLILITDKLLTAEYTKPKVTKQQAALAKKQNAKIDADLEKIRLSNTSTTLTSAIGELITNHDFQPIQDLLNARFDSLGNDFIKKTLFTMQTPDILRWKGDEVPALKDVDDLTQQMSAMRMRLMAASAKKAEALASFIRKNGSTELSDAMHLARLKKVSPTEHDTAADAIKADLIIKHYEQLNADPNTPVEDIPSNKSMITRRTNQINSVYTAWDALGKQKGGHAMYAMVRQYYQDAYTATRTLLNEQIEALPIDAAAKAKLLKSVRLMHERSVGEGAETEIVEADDGTPFAEISFKNLPEDYFPFKRYGQYWLRVEGGLAGREFYLFENGTERNLFLTRRARELGLDPKDFKTFKVGDDISALRKNFQDSSVMLQEMFANIDQATGEGRFDKTKFANAADPEAASKAALEAYKEELKDQLYQTYLQTMPERSFRKQFIHADKVAGFSADILRNFKTSAVAYSNQLAKLKYSTDISNTIQRARDSLDGMPTDMRGRLELFVNEMDIRANEEINPPEEGKVATRINQFAFIMLLTGAASAATQMASVPIMVMPTLAQTYGYGKASVQFAKMSNIFKSVGVTQQDAQNGDVTFTAPSLASSSMAKNDPNLNRAFQEAIQKYNLFSLTNTSVITNTNKTPASAYDNTPQTAARVAVDAMSALFTGAERMSREIAFAMTFNLEFAKTGNFEQSVQKAVATTNELLGRYDNMARPRILRNFVGKTVGQFKMYAVFQTSWFIRNGTAIFNSSLPKEARLGAMERLTGVLVMGGMFHGLVGMPLYSVICAAVDAALARFGDDEEEKKRRANNPLTADSSNLRFRYDFLPKYFGEIEIPGIDGRQHRLSEVLEKGPISALTDINIGSRTSFDGMWWRDAKPGKTYLESAQNIILANLGPGVSTGINMVGAVDDFSNGKIQRGLEKLVPAFFRGSFVASRLSEEGAETKGGDKLLKRNEINDLNLVAATLGYQSTRIARIQEKNFAFQKEIVEMESTRTKLLRRLNEIAFDPEADKTKIKSIFKDITKFNKRYPIEEYLIDDDTIEKSMETYMERKGMTFRGQYMPEKLLPYLAPAYQATKPLE
jgi:hypothetical protein